MAKRILIVEDHKDMMNILKKYLQEYQYEVIEAGTAEIGLEKFHSEPPDLILMDLMLPGMSGLEAVRRIKSEGSDDPYIPIIILTAKNEIDDIVEGLDSGADDYIIKPFHFDELIARIKSALRLKELNELLVKQSKDLEQANLEVGTLNKNLRGKNKELRKNIYNLHSLFEVALELNSILDLHRLVNSILLTLAGQFSSKYSLFLFAPKPEIDRLQLFNSKGYYLDSIAGIYIEKDDPLIHYFANHNLPTLMKDLKRKVKESQAIMDLMEAGVEIVTPINIKGLTEGIIGLGPRLENLKYTKNDIEHISILTNIISIAVANASLYHEIEQLSYTDGMTTLHNFRYFKLRLKEEIVRHKRTKTGLSLLILDVDNFKNFNDTMGHPAGDEVLKKLAAILKSTVRENDIVARYGGEEFAVILPAVEKEGARILADRIRENIEQTYFEHEEIQPLGKVTVSIGAASLPADGNDYATLLNSADTALYAAKNSGRNKVESYNEKMKSK